MQIEAGKDLAIEARFRLDDGTAVIAERGVDRQPPRRRLDDEAIEPFGRDQVEQRRRGDEIKRAFERKLEIARKIDGFCDDGDKRWAARVLKWRMSLSANRCPP